MIKKNANYVSTIDLAELADVTSKSIIRAIKRGEIKAIRLKRAFRIHKKEALKWLEKKQYIPEESDDN